MIDRKWLRMGLSVCISVIITGTAAELLVRFQDERKAETLVGASLSQAEIVAKKAMYSTHMAVGKGAACSPSDLSHLRATLYASRHLVDIGRISDGAVICSAVWGKTRPSFRMPKPSYGRDTTVVWRLEDLEGTPFTGTTALAIGDAVAIISQSAFEQMNFSFDATVALTTKDGLPLFGTNKSLVESAAGARGVRSEKCSKSMNLCASVRLPATSLAGLPSSILLVLLSVAVTGALLISRAMEAFIAKRRSQGEQLKRAILNGRISAEYQPLRSVKTGRLLGFEALARWTNEEGVRVSPDQFVPLAQELGLGVRLAEAVLKTSIDQLSNRLISEDLYLSVNVETQDVAHPTFVQSVLDQVGTSALEPRHLRFEVTERSDITDDLFFENMATLGASGYHFWIDDFGTGSANFSHLAKTQFSGIKIDRIFTTAILTDSPMKGVLPVLHSLAHSLGLETVIEGIETEDQLAMLRAAAPDAVGQGWHLGRPSAAEALPLS